MMTGCICCHGPLDAHGDCPICDAPRTLAEKAVAAVLEYLDEKELYVDEYRLSSPLFRSERRGMVQKVQTMLDLESPPAPSSQIVEIDYTNWRGERRTYRILPIGLTFGSNEWHTEPQWLLAAEDELRDLRYFALRSIHSWSPVA